MTTNFKRIGSLAAIAAAIATMVQASLSLRQDITGLYPVTAQERATIPYPYQDLAAGGWDDLQAKFADGARERRDLDNAIVLPALSSYVAFEGRFPDSVRAVLESPYSAASPMDLIDPMTGKPFASVGDTDPLSRDWIIIKGASAGYDELFHTVRLRDPKSESMVEWADPGSGRTLYDCLPMGPDRSRHTYRKGAIPDSVLTAQAVGGALQEAVNQFYKDQGRYPTSYSELMGAFPFLSKLRNAYSGGNANLGGTLQADAKGQFGSVYAPPGDFVMLIRDGRRAPVFVVFAEAGKDAASVLPSRADWKAFGSPAMIP